jgi:magnesium transporter
MHKARISENKLAEGAPSQPTGLAYFVDAQNQVQVADTWDSVRLAWKEGCLLWLPIIAKGKELEEFLGRDLAVHPLTIEDIWNRAAVAKLEDFPEYVQLIVQMVVSCSRKGVRLCEFDAVLGERFLVTWFEDAEVYASLVRNDAVAKLLTRGPAWVLHGLLDGIVDGMLPVVDGLDAEVLRLESASLEKAGTKTGEHVLAQIFALKRSLQKVRRIGIHQREVFYRLSRGDVDEVPAESLPFFRDVHDHYLRVADNLESYRELLASAADSFYSAQSSRLNEVIKRLTIVSTVMLPLSFVAGVYGMNFEKMPGLKSEWGFPISLLSMAMLAVSILLWMRYKKWIS